MPQESQNRQPPDDWQPLLARHRAALFLLARQYLPTPQDAEDAMQEGFIKFWNSRHKARDLTAYLFTCIRSAALDLRRARLSRHRHEQRTPAPASPLLQSSLESDERRRLVEAALTRLPEDQREVLILKIWADLTFTQIAHTLAIPANTAASRYRYALQHLESTLSREVTCD